MQSGEPVWSDAERLSMPRLVLATARVLPDLSAPVLLSVQGDCQVRCLRYSLGPPHPCLTSLRCLFSLNTHSWVYRQLSGQCDEPAAEVHNRIAQACDHCNWFISPRHGVSPFQNRAQQPEQIFGGGEGNNVRASEYCLVEADANSEDDESRKRVYDQLGYLIDHVTRPPSGCVLRLHFDGSDGDNNADRQLQQAHVLSYHVQRGKALHLDDHCFRLLFQCLSLDNVVYIINCMLLEQRILIHSTVRLDEFTAMAWRDLMAFIRLAPRAADTSL